MKTLTALTLMSLLLLTSCTSETRFGKCIGIDGERDAKLLYEANAKNIFLGIIFFETIIVPYFVIVDETYCPVGVK